LDLVKERKKETGLGRQNLIPRSYKAWAHKTVLSLLGKACCQSPTMLSYQWRVETQGKCGLSKKVAAFEAAN
jgi:hypothetical protein